MMRNTIHLRGRQFSLSERKKMIRTNRPWGEGGYSIEDICILYFLGYFSAERIIGIFSTHKIAEASREFCAIYTNCHPSHESDHRINADDYITPVPFQDLCNPRDRMQQNAVCDDSQSQRPHVLRPDRHHSKYCSKEADDRSGSRWSPS